MLKITQLFTNNGMRKDVSDEQCRRGEGISGRN